LASKDLWKINLLFVDQVASLFSMSKRTPPVFPTTSRQLAGLGERLRAARLRRRMTQAALAARSDVSLPTLRKLEQGEPSSSLATLLRVLQVLGLDKDIDALAKDDEIGRRLQDINQVGAPRGRRRKP
jgi:DNA-binding XRE family transcriptional regulator